MALTPPDPFEDVDWEELHKQLLVLAVRLFALRKLGGRVSVIVGVGASPADLVQGTILKALGGDGIRYEASRGRLLPYLKTALTNDFRDMLRQMSHKTTDRVNHSSDDGDTPQDGRTLDGFAHRATLSTEETANLFMDAKKAVQSEPTLTEYIEAIELGCTKPQDVADLCRVEVADIYQRRRKLERRLAGLVTP